MLSGTIGNKDEKFAELNDREVGSVDDMDESVGSSENDNVVEDNDDANVADDIKFKVLFRYMGNDGRPAKHKEEVVQNQHLPRFHIHNKYEKDGSTFTFKHWLLESGNLTSSLTVLSDLVFVAVYDETKDIDNQHTDIDASGKGSTIPEAEQYEITTSLTCDHCKSYVDSTGHTYGQYCDLTGLDPRRYEDHFEEIDACPYVKFMRELYGGRVSKTDIFKATTIIEVSDIANLLKALFKVNIDIAHREYFLKIDVP